MINYLIDSEYTNLSRRSRSYRRTSSCPVSARLSRTDIGRSDSLYCSSYTTIRPTSSPSA